MGSLSTYGCIPKNSISRHPIFISAKEKIKVSVSSHLFLAWYLYSPQLKSMKSVKKKKNPLYVTFRQEL